jgi:hypothetical protein
MEKKIAISDNAVTADVRCVMLGNDGQTYTQDYIGLNTVTNPDDLYFHFTVDGSHLVFE